MREKRLTISLIKNFFNILLLLFIFSNDSFSEGTCKNMVVEGNNEYFQTFCIGKDNFSVELQKIIDLLYSNGGGVIKLKYGKFYSKSPIELKPGVSIEGTEGGTKIVVDSEYGFIQSEKTYLENISIKNIIFENSESNKAKIVFLLRGHTRCKFENLSFKGFKDQILFLLEPKGQPAKNIVFNVYRDIYADACWKCVVYNGDGIPPKQPYSTITNNVWQNIIFRKVYSKAIEALQWVDSEKWYNLYAQAWDENVILIDLNVSKTEWKQVDRFHFYSPTLVYSPLLRNASKKPIAIRLGKGTTKHYFYNIITDKIWDNFFLDEGATSYYISVDSGKDNIIKAPQVYIYKKNVEEIQR